MTNPDDTQDSQDDTREDPPAEAPKPQAMGAGDDTIWAMHSAGIFKREKGHKRALQISAAVGGVLVLVVGLDLAGVWQIPGMGAVYNMTGIQNPHVEPQPGPTAGDAKHALSAAERAALRRKLLGTGGGSGKTQGIKDTKHLSRAQRDLASSIFSDSRKKESNIQLSAPSKITVPSLPDGLTQDALMEVIGKNNRSMSLCIAQSMKAGESLKGKMEVEITIGATGSVSSAHVASSKFRNTAMGRCAAKTLKRWRFPAFNGEPVTVSVPYVMSGGI